MIKYKKEKTNKPELGLRILTHGQGTDIHSGDKKADLGLLGTGDGAHHW